MNRRLEGSDVPGYIRVSDVNGRNGDSFISPDVQRETVTRLAQAKGLELGEIVTELEHAWLEIEAGAWPPQLSRAITS